MTRLKVSALLLPALAVSIAGAILMGVRVEDARSSSVFQQKYGDKTGSELAEYLDLTPTPVEGCVAYARSPVGNFCLDDVISVDGIVFDEVEGWEIWQRLNGHIPTDAEFAEFADFNSIAQVGQVPADTSSSHPVTVWHSDEEGVCFSRVTIDPESPPDWCSGPVDSPGGIWYEDVRGLCLTHGGQSSTTWCSNGQPGEPVAVSYNQSEGLFLSGPDIDPDGPSRWCSGDQDIGEVPAGVWLSETAGVCFRVETEAPDQWCSGWAT